MVPFRGSADALRQTRASLRRLRLREGDTIVVVDNTPGRDTRGTPEPDAVPVLVASERLTPGYARNRGAALGRGEWLIFIDADTDPTEDLLERYFEPSPAGSTALLAGGVIDEPVPPDAPAPARYAYLRRTLDQGRTIEMGTFAFAQSANIACRRSAFEAVGGFRESIRAAEDADLSYRLKAAGGGIERREHAVVVHRSRRSTRAFVAQAALHGAGSAWLDRAYPGSFPARRRPGLIWWALRMAATGSVRAARRRDRDELVRGLYEPLWELAFEFGRSRSVEHRPDRRPERARRTR